MRSFIGTSIFLIVGLTAALMIGFYPISNEAPVLNDDEQIGLNQQIVIKFSHIVAENTPKGLAAQRFADLVHAKTNGRVKVEVYPNGLLYSESDELDALKSGKVQMIAPAMSNISEWVPAFSVMDLPYAFLSQAAVQEAFDGRIGELLKQELERKQVIGMAFWGNGFKQMTNKQRPLIQPADFSGLRFRVLPGRVIESQFRQLGAKALPLHFNQVYRNLEQGVVDAEENTASNIYSKKFYQLQRYMTLSNHGYLGYAVLMNQTYWDKLPPELHQPILDAMKEATVYANENAALMNNRELENLRKLPNLQIHELTDEEKRQWIAVWEPVYLEYSSIIGDELLGLVRELQIKYAK